MVTVLLFLAYENRTQKEVCLFKKYLRSNYTRGLCPFSERLKGTKSKWPAVLIRAGHSEYVRALDGQETYDNDSSNYNIIWGLERMRTDRGAWVRMRGKTEIATSNTHNTDYAVISISLGSSNRMLWDCQRNGALGFESHLSENQSYAVFRPNYICRFHKTNTFFLLLMSRYD